MADAAAPGWYHAEGDPDGTERFWDGSSWTQGPRPVGGAPETSDFGTPTPSVETPDTGDFGTPDAGGFGAAAPAAAAGGFAASAPTTPPMPQDGFPGAPGAMSPPGFGQVYAEESKSTLALILSIVGAVLILTGFGVILSLPLGIAGAMIANKDKKAIDAGQRDPSKRGTDVAAVVIGILAAVVSLLGIIGFIILFAALAAA